MENKELNLCEILKDCPKGQTLYSPYLGIVSFGGIYEDIESIEVINIEGGRYLFSQDGRYIDNYGGEVSLFPSKDNRDWSTFKTKNERFDPNTLKPFDKVLIKHTYENERWVCNFFSDILPNGEIHCIGLIVLECIPYNDDTAHLVGTTDDAPEYYKWWEE